MSNKEKGKKMTIEKLARITQAGFADIGRRFDLTQHHMDERFTKIDDRFERVEFRLERIEHRFDMMDDRVLKLETGRAY